MHKFKVWCVPFHEVQPQLSTVRQGNQLQTGGHAHPTFKLRSHTKYPRNLQVENVYKVRVGELTFDFCLCQESLISVYVLLLLCGIILDSDSMWWATKLINYN